MLHAGTAAEAGLAAGTPAGQWERPGERARLPRVAGQGELPLARLVDCSMFLSSRPWEHLVYVLKIIMCILAVPATW